MKTTLILLIVSMASGGMGYYLGAVKAKASSYEEGRKFGFALGRMYYASGDSFDRMVIGAVFSKELEHSERQDLILHHKIAKAGKLPTMGEHPAKEAP